MLVLMRCVGILLVVLHVTVTMDMKKILSQRLLFTFIGICEIFQHLSRDYAPHDDSFLKLTLPLDSPWLIHPI